MLFFFLIGEKSWEEMTPKSKYTSCALKSPSLLMKQVKYREREREKEEKRYHTE